MIDLDNEEDAPPALKRLATEIKSDSLVAIAPITVDTILSAFKTSYNVNTKDDWFGFLFCHATETSGSKPLNIELGRRQVMSLYRADKTASKVAQVTIREIDIPIKFQKCGLLNKIIDYLFTLPGIDAVQLEAVINRSFARHLLSNPNKWVIQCFNELNDPDGVGYSFVRYKE